jgi:hypothetical protein
VPPSRRGPRCQSRRCFPPLTGVAAAPGGSGPHPGRVGRGGWLAPPWLHTAAGGRRGGGPGPLPVSVDEHRAEPEAPPGRLHEAAARGRSPLVLVPVLAEALVTGPSASQGCSRCWTRVPVADRPRHDHPRPRHPEPFGGTSPMTRGGRRSEGLWVLIERVPGLRARPRQRSVLLTGCACDVHGCGRVKVLSRALPRGCMAVS